MLLASEISCSRSNVLVPVSAWSSPAESVSRSRCISAISVTVCSYSSRSSPRRSSRASRICCVSAAVRVPRLAGALVAVLASVVLGSAVLAIVAPSAVGADVALVVASAFVLVEPAAEAAGVELGTGVAFLVALVAGLAGAALAGAVLAGAVLAVVVLAGVAFLTGAVFVAAVLVGMVVGAVEGVVVGVVVA